MIPIILLWNVKVKRSQKMLLSIFLCLSVCMIVIAIVRISGLRLSNKSPDVQWETFFQQVEASVSVITISLTAFRSLLGLKALKAREKKHRAWYSYQRIALFRNRHKTSESELNGERLPSIPGATLSGIRTFIRGDRDSKNDEADVMGPRDGTMDTEHHITVTQKISSDSEAVRFPARNSVSSLVKTLTDADVIRFRRKARFRPSILFKSFERPKTSNPWADNIKDLNRRVYTYDKGDGDEFSSNFAKKKIYEPAVIKRAGI